MEVISTTNKEKLAKVVEYLVISDKNSKVLLSTHDYIEAKALSSKIAQAGGSSTVFKSIR
jgi:ABC-type nitrate/sulfonate/bicarbonate transport system ATPase subunit